MILAALIAISFSASATNDKNPCGNSGNNCDTGGGNASATGGNAYASAAAGAVAGAAAGANASVCDVTNAAQGGAGGSSVAFGGAGGRGGDANQAQGQQQGQQQSNIGINGQQQSASSDQSQSSTNTQTTDASSRNDNRSNASGNATNVNIGGDTYQTKRNAPGIVGGSVFPTATCKAGFGIGGSGAAGGGLINIATTDKECQTIVLSQNFAAIGKNETACELLKVTKTWARAVKKNPALAESCK